MAKKQEEKQEEKQPKPKVQPAGAGNKQEDKPKHPAETINYEEKYKRALADYQNLLKRMEAEKQELVKFANEQLLLKIIPIYDNLRLAWQHAAGFNSTEGNNNKKNILEGLGYILKQFKSVLAEAGIQEIKTEKEVFAPQTMEAVETKKTTDKAKDNLVAQEIKPGYTLYGRTLIPARVVVYKYEKKDG